MEVSELLLPLPNVPPSHLLVRLELLCLTDTVLFEVVCAEGMYQQRTELCTYSGSGKKWAFLGT